ncbi:hypothetical protein [Gilliamella sp. Pas-s25]|uniref:hypothetical protein n=1 Tax=Gilliamella sp. Pas-s25 TaxID=2687310 RepID=UPI00135D5E32|nr:hypothetical protein [Gilliamella sp. Pas-s25]MWP61148.1 hypothetical protein [Gilliamella sp. Pas-s25]
MQYNFFYQMWQHYALTISKYSSGIICTPNSLNRYTQDCRKCLLIANKWLCFTLKQRLLLTKRPLSCLSTLSLLLSYSLNTQALSAVTTNIIQGSAPYLTFDGGKTKATTTEDLLSITLSDGTTITPANNTSTAKKPIVLPNAEETLANVGMFVPASKDSIELKELINSSYNFWGDDDGDGQGENGVTATGSLSISFTDRYNQKVSRSHVLDICGAPYKVVLSSTGGMLKTQYGVPNSSTFSESTVSYFITPVLTPKVCYIKAGDLRLDVNQFAGPEGMWNPDKGFIASSNFPNTGINGIFFDLYIEGSGPLTWPTITQAGITAKMRPNSAGSSVRITLTGPKVNGNRNSISKPDLPQKFELVGYDSSGKSVIKYGFELQKWFVNRGSRFNLFSSHENWCKTLGYRVIQVKDFTNANCTGLHSSCQSAKPSSARNHYHRRIGGGLLSEWGYMTEYMDLVGLPSDNAYWTSDVVEGKKLVVTAVGGQVKTRNSNETAYGMCVYP